MHDDLAMQVQGLLDRQQIERLHPLYCRALDRLDLELLKSIYHEDAIEEHGEFKGRAHDFADHIIPRLRDMFLMGYHTLTQSIIDLIPGQSTATGEFYYFAYHLIKGGRESLQLFFGQSYTRAAEAQGAADRPHEYLCGGRYLSQFAKRDGVWKISRHTMTNEWSTSRPLSRDLEGGAAAGVHVPGSRDGSDVLYNFFRE